MKAVIICCLAFFLFSCAKEKKPEPPAEEPFFDEAILGVYNGMNYIITLDMNGYYQYDSIATVVEILRVSGRFYKLINRTSATELEPRPFVYRDHYFDQTVPGRITVEFDTANRKITYILDQSFYNRSTKFIGYK